MESDPEARPASDDAAQQLHQLEGDQRWATLTSFPRRGFDATTGGGVIVSLMLFAVMTGDLGPVSDQVLVLATLDVFLPLYAIGWALHHATGSWRGTPADRPTAAETVTAAASYAVGLATVIVSARHQAWVLVVVAATVVGIVWMLLCRRWLVRYRAEFGYQPVSWLYLRLAGYVVVVLACNLAIAYAFVLVARWF